MAVIDRVEELEESVLNQVVVAKITSPVQNLAKEITIWTVIHNDEGAIVLFDDAVKCDDIRVGRCTFVESNLLDMKASLADSVSRRRVKKTLDGVGRGIVGSRTKVDRAINDPVTAITQDAYEFEGAIVDESADRGGARKGSGRHCQAGSAQTSEMSSEKRERGIRPFGERRRESKSRGSDARKD
jgi:hypothetical protein